MAAASLQKRVYTGERHRTYSPHMTQQTTRQSEQPSDNQQWSLLLAEVAETKSKAAYSRLFNHFAPRLKQFAIRLCGSEALALELVQDTMMSVWQKAHLYNPAKGAASTWIYTIARNLRYDMMRKASNKACNISAEDLWPILESEPEDANVSPEHQILQLQLEKYYHALSESQMEVIRKVYLEDKPQQQVADELNIPLGTVKSRIRLAVQKLQDQIGGQHD